MAIISMVNRSSATRRSRHEPRIGFYGLPALIHGQAFPVQEDDHLYTVLRFVERNALRANLVKRAEIWRWSSLFHREAGGLDPVRPHRHRWPLPYPEDWLTRVNRAETEAELEAVRRSVERNQPCGSERWQKRTAKGLGLEYTFRKPGRPK